IPKGREADYTLNESLADEAIKYIYQQKSVTPDRPFFIYYAPGATHSPHHVPKEWIEKFKGQFDQGWDNYREETFRRQLDLGVIPADTMLTPRPAEIPAWASLSADQKRVASRLMETFAGFTAQTDFQVGRVLDALDTIGQPDNTLVFWEIGDNGASMEGTLYGAFNNTGTGNGVPEDTTFILAHLDDIGGPRSDNHIPVGWAWAMDTPFQWGKQIASHFGGTRNPLVISWPKRIKDRGGIRTQFHHCIDIVPTILEAAGVEQPSSVNGVAQKPIEGISMVYSFDDANAEERHRVQYFEMFGNRAIYSNGWVAAVRHGRLPWETVGTYDFDKDKWELYRIDGDFSEAKDLAAAEPKILRDMQDLFLIEAAKYQVLPLDDRFIERSDPSLRPSLMAGRTDFSYYPGAKIPESSAANVKNRSHSITAHVEVPETGGDGVLVAAGGAASGFVLHVKDGRPIYEYNFFLQQRFKIESSEKLAAGSATIRMDFKYDGGGLAKGGLVTLFVNDRKVGEGRVEKTVMARFSAGETFDIGLDTGSPVSEDYKSPNPYTGILRKVEVHLEPIGHSENERMQKAGRDVELAVAASEGAFWDSRRKKSLFRSRFPESQPHLPLLPPAIRRMHSPSLRHPSAL
ncbi:MAG TPA: sulfatase-like hydrolase/transferase, partial [Blastocatellia bacterium]